MNVAHQPLLHFTKGILQSHVPTAAESSTPLAKELAILIYLRSQFQRILLEPGPWAVVDGNEYKFLSRIRWFSVYSPLVVDAKIQKIQLHGIIGCLTLLF